MGLTMSQRKLPTTGTGILVGRPIISKASYEYVIIPRDRTDIDVLVTTLPAEIMSDRYIINTRMIMELLKGIYIVDYRWHRRVSNNQFIDLGEIIKVHGRVDIDIDNPLESLRKIDDTSEYNEVHDVVSVDMTFIRGVMQAASGVITHTPKRTLSMQVASRVKEDRTPVILNIVETYAFLQSNPGIIRGIGVLRRYKLPVIVLDEIPLDDLKEKIIYNMNVNIAEFHRQYSSPTTLMTEEI